MHDIFVSYRRSDAPTIVGRIIDRLESSFGNERIFRDIDSIDYGQDFGETIHNALADCRVVLVIIGSDWLSAENEVGDRRLEDPQDWVRQEVSAALKSKIDVIPVLVENAEMPSGSRLPDDLKLLAKRNAARVREDPDFDADMARLCTAIGEQIGRPGARAKWIRTSAIALLLVVVLGFALAALLPDKTPLGSSGQSNGLPNSGGDVAENDSAIADGKGNSSDGPGIDAAGFKKVKPDAPAKQDGLTFRNHTNKHVVMYIYKPDDEEGFLGVKLTMEDVRIEPKGTTVWPQADDVYSELRIKAMELGSLDPIAAEQKFGSTNVIGISEGRMEIA